MTELNQKDWEETRLKTANSVLLDVRSEEEFDAIHIPNARMIDIRQPQAFMEEVQTLDKDKEYFVYCRSGARSAQACQVLDQLGVAATYNLVGGILGWTGEVVE
ncbi:MAG: rhodanese-like domain-containing protein [Flavobacteriaceae bacterium]|nr:rhodanese-like domain-containing protein [Flavobacteriaceae bacterium]